MRRLFHTFLLVLCVGLFGSFATTGAAFADTQSAADVQPATGAAIAESPLTVSSTADALLASSATSSTGTTVSTADTQATGSGNAAEPTTTAPAAADPSTAATATTTPATSTAATTAPPTTTTSGDPASTTTTATTASTPAATLAQASSAAAATTVQGSTTPLPDGVYNIATSLNGSKYVEIGGGSTANGGQAQVYQNNSTPAQRWRFFSTGDGYYKIVNVNSDKVLDVSSASTKNGAKVQQYSWNGSNAQKWMVDSNGQGAYRIISALSASCVLDLAGASISNATHVQLYANNGTAAQLWRLMQITQTLDDGYYTVASKKSSKVIDVAGGSIENGGNVQQYDRNGTLAQTVHITWDTDSGYYTLMDAVSGKVLDVAAGSNRDGANIQQYSSNGTAAQKWVVSSNGDGSYTFISALGGRVMDVDGGSTRNGANVQLYRWNGTNAQKWTITANSNWLPNGVYQIITAVNHGNALSVTAASQESAAKLQTAISSSSAWSQKWMVQNNGAGFYTIVNLNSGKTIDVSSGAAGLYSGSLLQQYESNATDAQLWQPVLVANGIMFHSKLAYDYVFDIRGGSSAALVTVQLYTANYTNAQKYLLKSTDVITSGAEAYVRNVVSGTVLDVAGGSTASGATVQLYSSNGSDAQKFKMVYVGSGQYRLMNVKSGKYLDLDTNTNTKIQQWGLNGGASMKWTVAYDAAAHAFTLCNVNTGAYLSLVDGNLALASSVTSDSQRFRFVDAGLRLNGFDMASYQNGIDLASVPSDFVIIKATQGAWYPYDNFAGYASSALSLGKLLGLYHYAEGDKSAATEAKYFVDTVSNYVGKGVLILDWEGDAVSKGVSYAKTWLDTVYSLTGVKPLIYMSRSETTAYNWSSVASKYDLWVADNYNRYSGGGYQSDPYVGTIGYWSSPTMTQFTSSGKLSGWDSYLDLNTFYGDASMWQRLARAS